jgi:hypothetical protein
MAVLLTIVAACPAQAVNFGSNLQRTANTAWGCESAPVNDPFAGGATLQPTGQTTCTLRSLGRIGSSRNWRSVPGPGRVTRIRIRSGANPAPLRLTILQAAVTTYEGQAGGDYNCCTATFLGRVFRPRANAVTTRNVNVPVSRERDGRTTYIDEVALSVMGPGTLPLHDDGSGGQLATGSPWTAFHYPITRRDEPRDIGLSADGLELLFRWTFQPR